jgi:hypothetical protein
MNFNDILGLRAWTPLSEVSKDELDLIVDNVYALGSDVYLRTQPHNRAYEVGDPRAPFVTKAYWSPSVEGLKRLILGDPSFHASEPLSIAPSELALGTTGLYSEILKQAWSTNAQVAERAIYSNKGAFLSRVISVGRLSYCFQSHEDKDERAFLIEISLVK